MITCIVHSVFWNYWSLFYLIKHHIWGILFFICYIVVQSSYSFVIQKSLLFIFLQVHCTKPCLITQVDICSLYLSDQSYTTIGKQFQSDYKNQLFLLVIQKVCYSKKLVIHIPLGTLYQALFNNPSRHMLFVLIGSVLCTTPYKGV